MYKQIGTVTKIIIILDNHQYILCQQQWLTRFAVGTFLSITQKKKNIACSRQ